MTRLFVLPAALLGLFGAPSIAAHAASFDCTKAGTPFERAICDNPELSAADTRLAATYESAVGGLSEAARGAVRTGQREWLSYAQRACSRDAKPLVVGVYDDRGVSCLVEIFNSRSTVLEQSRMVEGIRFYPMARYEALPDPNEIDNPDSWSPVAHHELSWIEIDGAQDFAADFNAAIAEDALALSPVIAGTIGPDSEDDGSTSDTDNSLGLEAVAGASRITLNGTTYWYGHGAAHGNWGIFYRHYLVKEGRFMQASDLFSGEGWEAALVDLALAAAEAEHGDNLMLDDTSYMAEAVVDPQRWDLSDPYALVIQFQPYEIAAYAYGAPEVRVKWEDIEGYLVDGADEIRFGY
ncbi:DUF3298 domain-containing protein [Devosia chinhatensis]|uniref:DUF3298 domain-containing protein n=1 Tax=Devosia chinhatensis TaxID=429727 RepID=UPI000A9B3574|nr:DUF3298 domain-containing protein [Devosia chinhatensis]